MPLLPLPGAPCTVSAPLYAPVSPSRSTLYCQCPTVRPCFPFQEHLLLSVPHCMPLLPLPGAHSTVSAPLYVPVTPARSTYCCQCLTVCPCYPFQEHLLLSVLPKHVAETMRQDLGSGGDGQFKKIYMSRHENVR